MTTQGAPKTTRRKPVAAKVNPLVKPEVADPTDEVFDVEAWLAKRGLTGKRRVLIGGESFTFKKAVAADVLIEYQQASQAEKFPEALSTLLADRDQTTAFLEAFNRQRQPVLPDDLTDYVVSLINFVLVGDPDVRSEDGAEETMGESSAS